MSVLLLSCVATVQQVLSTEYRNQKLKKRPGPTKGCRAVDDGMNNKSNGAVLACVCSSKLESKACHVGPCA
jgi:hypothetical protein